MTLRKCFVPDTPSFCDHIWSRLELFNEIEHKMALISIIITMDTRPPEKLVMIREISSPGDLLGYQEKKEQLIVTEKNSPKLITQS